MINLRQYSHFIAVLESASLLEAARKLNLSQPALSKSIGALESYYGVELFRRLPRGVRPTAFALTLEPHARRLLLDEAESRAEMAAVAAGSSGTVAIGVGAAFVQIVSDTILELEREAPNVQFKVITDHGHNLRQALLANRIEFYLGMANNEMTDPAFAVDLMFSDAFVGICSPRHPFAGQVVAPAKCRDSEWIVPDLEEPGRAALDAYFLSTLKRKPKVKVTTNADQLIRQFLSETRYLSMAPESPVNKPGFQGFGQFRLEGFAFRREVGIVRRAGHISTPLGRRFSKMLSARLPRVGSATGAAS
ncbi:LysR family transcriptional regulator [Marinovum sp.]|uniref:LysR family transcriptional regulator n=1 Tax=Marinovum sp. TaxID=2024839 RepID=UPI002B26BECF|nr:LysR family transcriptional regulator [Marinovum sp.]